MERNPNNTHERMLTCQPIEKANDAIKVAILEEGKDAVYCDAVADHSVSHTRGEHNNIVLEDGVYDFYYKIDENSIDIMKLCRIIIYNKENFAFKEFVIFLCANN